MHYIIAFLFSILIIIKPLKCCSLTIHFVDGIEVNAYITDKLKLRGESYNSVISLRNHFIIDRNNLKHPLDGISQIELIQGMAKVGNTVKTAPAIFDTIYVDSNNLSTFIKPRSHELANLFIEITEEHFSVEEAQAIYQCWPHRPGAHFTKAEFDKAMAMISATENKTQGGYLAELLKSFSEERALALYQNSPYRPGAHFTKAEFDKPMAMISAAENKTQDGYLYVLQENFPEPRALALYQNSPYRPGADFTKAEFNEAIKLLRNAPNRTEAACLAELQKYFSFKRALALYQNSPYRPGADFTKAEFNEAMAIMYVTDSQTQYGYLAELIKSFSWERAVALSLYHCMLDQEIKRKKVNKAT